MASGSPGATPPPGPPGRFGLTRLRIWLGRLRTAGSDRPTLRKARWILGSLLFVIVVLLVIGDPDDGIARRQAAGKQIRAKDYLRTYGWYTGAGNGAAVALLLLTSSLWAREADAPQAPSLARPGPAGLAVKVAVAGAVVIGGSLAAPRLDHSLWRDEEITAARYVDGDWHEHDTGWSFHPVTWRETLFSYDSPNNHVGYSVLSRISSGVRDRLLGRGPFASETAMRLPAFVAGLAAVVSIAWLLWRLGWPYAGAIAAWLLALHPWWSRYASEARGYSVNLLGATAAPALLAGALARGTWRRWLGFGAVQCLVLWANASLVFLLVPLNLGALLFIWQTHRGTEALGVQLSRFVVSNVAAGLVFLQLMLPNLLQVGTYIETTRGTKNLTDWLIPNVLSHLLIGISWKFRFDRDPEIYPDLAARVVDGPVVFAAVVVAVMLCLVAGLWRLWRRDWYRAATGLAFLLCAPLAWVFSFLREDAVYPWYFVFAVPGLVALVALGLDAARAEVAERAGGLVGWVVPAAFAVALAWIALPAHTALITRSIKPERESVLLTRSDLDPRAPSNALLTTVQCPDKPQHYDPRMITVADLEMLERVIAAAVREGHTLFANCGRLHHVRKYQPTLIGRLEQGADFEELAFLPGMTPEQSRVVYRWRGPVATSTSRPPDPVASP